MKEIKLSEKEMLNIIDEMEEVLCWIESKLSRGKVFKKSRKEELLEVLQEGGLYSVSDLSKIMTERCGSPISNRNVSSLLSYLRDDGHEIVKIGRGVGKLKLIQS